MDHGLGESDLEFDEYYDHTDCHKNTLARLSEYFDLQLLQKKLAETNEEYSGKKLGSKKKSEPSIFNRDKIVTSKEAKFDNNKSKSIQASKKEVSTINFEYNGIDEKRKDSTYKRIETDGNQSSLKYLFIFFFSNILLANENQRRKQYEQEKEGIETQRSHISGANIKSSNKNKKNYTQKYEFDEKFMMENIKKDIYNFQRIDFDDNQIDNTTGLKKRINTINNKKDQRGLDDQIINLRDVGKVDNIFSVPKNIKPSTNRENTDPLYRRKRNISMLFDREVEKNKLGNNSGRVAIDDKSLSKERAITDASLVYIPKTKAFMMKMEKNKEIFKSNLLKNSFFFLNNF